jgi:hypothetical protein
LLILIELPHLKANLAISSFTNFIIINFLKVIVPTIVSALLFSAAATAILHRQCRQYATAIHESTDETDTPSSDAWAAKVLSKANAAMSVTSCGNAKSEHSMSRAKVAIGHRIAIKLDLWVRALISDLGWGLSSPARTQRSKIAARRVLRAGVHSTLHGVVFAIFCPGPARAPPKGRYAGFGTRDR